MGAFTRGIGSKTGGEIGLILFDEPPAAKPHSESSAGSSWADVIPRLLEAPHGTDYEAIFLG